MMYPYCLFVNMCIANVSSEFFVIDIFINCNWVDTHWQ